MPVCIEHNIESEEKNKLNMYLNETWTPEVFDSRKACNLMLVYENIRMTSSSTTVTITTLECSSSSSSSSFTCEKGKAQQQHQGS